MVESIEIAPHLQSWFLLFEPWVPQHPAFQNIFSQPLSAMTKEQIIENGEIALSSRLNEAGFRYEAPYLSKQAGLIARRHAINPAHILWRELAFDIGVPFLKIDLLKKNPMGLESADEILKLVEPIDRDLCRMIRSHLKRTGIVKTNPEPRNNAVRIRIRAYRYALFRKGFRLNRQGSKMLEVLNFIKYELFLAAMHAVRAGKVLLSQRPKPENR